MARDAGEQGLPVGTIAKALAAHDLTEAIEAQEQMRDRYEHERQAEPVEADHARPVQRPRRQRSSDGTDE